MERIDKEMAKDKEIVILVVFMSLIGLVALFWGIIVKILLVSGVVYLWYRFGNLKKLVNRIKAKLS